MIISGWRGDVDKLLLVFMSPVQTSDIIEWHSPYMPSSFLSEVQE